MFNPPILLLTMMDPGGNPYQTGECMKFSSAMGTGILLAAVLGGPMVSAAADSPRYLVVDKSDTRAQLPFSDAVQAGNTLYVSGTLGLDANGQVPADPKVEARQVMEAVQHTLQAAGYQLDDLVSVQIFCTNLDLYAGFNEVYRTFFPKHFPARAFIGASQLVRGAHFEVMGTAVHK
jgi:2-iminobutanoate/2-iminopropanoate deaminase